MTERGFSPESSENNIERKEKTSFVQNDWVDIGIVDVEIDKINLTDSWVHSTSDFHKVSYEEMRQGLEDLQKVVHPAVDQGATGDDFGQIDQANSRDYSHGYQRIYDAFYGEGSIRLTRVGDKYEVTNGYHRLFVAKEMGMKTIPARVIQKRFEF